MLPNPGSIVCPELTALLLSPAMLLRMRCAARGDSLDILSVLMVVDESYQEAITREKLIDLVLEASTLNTDRIAVAQSYNRLLVRMPLERLTDDHHLGSKVALKVQQALISWTADPHPRFRKMNAFLQKRPCLPAEAMAPLVEAYHRSLDLGIVDVGPASQTASLVTPKILEMLQHSGNELAVAAVCRLLDAYYPGVGRCGVCQEPMNPPVACRGAFGGEHFKKGCGRQSVQVLLLP